MSSEVQRYLELDDGELLMEIARLADPRAPLSNPEHRREAGYAVVEGQLGRIRRIICPRREFIDSPEFELATVITGALLDHLTLGLASAVAAYIAKRGVLWLCRGQEVQATAKT